jgi:hypothetical protein
MSERKVSPGQDNKPYSPPGGIFNDDVEADAQVYLDEISRTIAQFGAYNTVLMIRTGFAMLSHEINPNS